VKCLQYWGREVERPIPSYKIFHGGLIDLIEESLAFVMSRIDHEVGEPSGSGVAPGRDELPELAVREAIVNAICHRDYSDNGSVQVMLFSDRLEIINPGTLPKGWTADRLLKTHDSKARNLTLAQALNWAGYVEKSGNGTESIVRRCLEAGLPKPQYIPDNVDFKAIIWRNPKRLGTVGAQSGLSQGSVGAQSGLSQNQIRVQSQRESCLILLSSADYGRKDLATALGVKSRTGHFGRMLADLVEDGLIELTIPEKPNSRMQKYRLTEKGRLTIHK
jgi:predicted HTH transcriptional regulator